ncbi:hypothetical protein BLNAU_13356 [Blattamonas nauphoetae]|uniref:Uncharacterized protein n=1 Tax=Blattamonas nauphoetae TaxID=2049346 RepID=A0ABQ9XLP9_9EUKA|nr:hypothetical protein BLNAU_13356 [Blattamonas nauphoetae]
MSTSRTNHLMSQLKEEPNQTFSPQSRPDTQSSAIQAAQQYALQSAPLSRLDETYPLRDVKLVWDRKQRSTVSHPCRVDIKSLDCHIITISRPRFVGDYFHLNELEETRLAMFPKSSLIRLKSGENPNISPILIEYRAPLVPDSSDAAYLFKPLLPLKCFNWQAPETPRPLHLNEYIRTSIRKLRPDGPDSQLLLSTDATNSKQTEKTMISNDTDQLPKLRKKRSTQHRTEESEIAKALRKAAKKEQKRLRAIDTVRTTPYTQVKAFPGLPSYISPLNPYANPPQPAVPPPLPLPLPLPHTEQQNPPKTAVQQLISTYNPMNRPVPLVPIRQDQRIYQRPRSISPVKSSPHRGRTKRTRDHHKKRDSDSYDEELEIERRMRRAERRKETDKKTEDKKENDQRYASIGWLDDMPFHPIRVHIKGYEAEGEIINKGQVSWLHKLDLAPSDEPITSDTLLESSLRFGQHKQQKPKEFYPIIDFANPPLPLSMQTRQLHTSIRRFFETRARPNHSPFAYAFSFSSMPLFPLSVDHVSFHPHISPHRAQQISQEVRLSFHQPRALPSSMSQMYLSSHSISPEPAQIPPIRDYPSLCTCGYPYTGHAKITTFDIFKRCLPMSENNYTDAHLAMSKFLKREMRENDIVPHSKQLLETIESMEQAIRLVDERAASMNSRRPRDFSPFFTAGHSNALSKYLQDKDKGNPKDPIPPLHSFLNPTNKTSLILQARPLECEKLGDQTAIDVLTELDLIVYYLQTNLRTTINRNYRLLRHMEVNRDKHRLQWKTERIRCEAIWIEITTRKEAHKAQQTQSQYPTPNPATYQFPMPHYMGSRQPPIGAMGHQYTAVPGVVSTYSGRDTMRQQYSVTNVVGQQYFIPGQMSSQYSSASGMGSQHHQTYTSGQQYPPNNAMGQQYPPNSAMGQQYSSNNAMGQQYSSNNAMGQQYPPTNHSGPQQSTKNTEETRISEITPVGSSLNSRTAEQQITGDSTFSQTLTAPPVLESSNSMINWSSLANVTPTPSQPSTTHPSAVQTSTVQTSTDQTSTVQTSTDQTSTGHTPTDQTSTLQSDSIPTMIKDEHPPDISPPPNLLPLPSTQVVMHPTQTTNSPHQVVQHSFLPIAPPQPRVPQPPSSMAILSFPDNQLRYHYRNKYGNPARFDLTGNYPPLHGASPPSLLHAIEHTILKYDSIDQEAEKRLEAEKEERRKAGKSVIKEPVLYSSSFSSPAAYRLSTHALEAAEVPPPNYDLTTLPSSSFFFDRTDFQNLIGTIASSTEKGVTVTNMLFYEAYRLYQMEMPAFKEKEGLKKVKDKDGDWEERMHKCEKRVKKLRLLSVPHPPSASLETNNQQQNTKDETNKDPANIIIKEPADAIVKEPADTIAKEPADAIAKESPDAIVNESTDAIVKEPAEKINEAPEPPIPALQNNQPISTQPQPSSQPIISSPTKATTSPLSQPQTTVSAQTPSQLQRTNFLTPKPAAQPVTLHSLISPQFATPQQHQQQFTPTSQRNPQFSQSFPTIQPLPLPPMSTTRQYTNPGFPSFSAFSMRPKAISTPFSSFLGFRAPPFFSQTQHSSQSSDFPQNNIHFFQTSPYSAATELIRSMPTSYLAGTNLTPRYNPRLSSSRLSLSFVQFSTFENDPGFRYRYFVIASRKLSQKMKGNAIHRMEVSKMMGKELTDASTGSTETDLNTTPLKPSTQPAEDRVTKSQSPSTSQSPYSRDDKKYLSFLASNNAPVLLDSSVFSPSSPGRNSQRIQSPLAHPSQLPQTSDMSAMLERFLPSTQSTTNLTIVPVQKQNALATGQYTSLAKMLRIPLSAFPPKMHVPPILFTDITTSNWWKLPNVPPDMDEDS